MKGTGAWLMLLFLGILLVVVGFQGSVGKIVAVAFAPVALEQQTGASATGSF